MQVGSFRVTVDDAIPPTVRASGELDQSSCAAFESILTAALDKSADRINLALVDVTFVDSSGLTVLISAALRGQKVGRRLSIVSMSQHLNHMLTISGFEHLFGTSDLQPVGEEKTAPSRTVMEPCSFAVKRQKGACKTARDQVYEFARGMGFDQLTLDDIKLAVGEAVSNAVRHGAECGETIDVHCSNSPGKLVVTLKYPSAEFDPLAIPTPTYSTAAEGGMGIYFMRLVMDEVRYEFAEGHTQVTLEKRIQAGGPD